GPRTPAAAPEKREKGKRAAADKAGAHADETPATLVAAIAEKDLFDMSRQKASEETRPADQPLAVTGPPANVTLVGVRIFGKDREVFVTEAGAQQLPADVRQKLEHMKQNPGNSRSGRSRR